MNYYVSCFKNSHFAKFTTHLKKTIKHIKGRVPRMKCDDNVCSLHR